MSPRRKEFDQQQALMRATHAFWSRGLSGLSYSQVLADMGIGRQSSYDTFGNLEQLFERAFGCYASVRKPVFAALNAPDADLSTLRRHFVSSIGYFVSHPKTPACLATRTLLEVEPAHRKMASTLMRTMEAGFVHCLRGAQRSGQLREGICIEGAARAASLLWHGIGADASGGASVDELTTAIDAVIDGWRRQ